MTSNYIDPGALMRVKSLELRARMIMEGFWKGLHRSPFHGFSVEFSEYRPYSRGDDPRFLDWKVMARSDRAFIKKFEDETNLRAHFLLDRSQSMTYGSASYTKQEYAATLAATLSYFLMGQNDAVGLTTFDHKVDQHIPARNRPGQLRRLMLQLEKAPAGKSTDLGAAMKGLHELIRKRSLIILISDLLAPLEELEKQIGYLAAGGHDLVIFQTMDRQELDFNFEKAAHYRDTETGRDLFIDPNIARASYLDRLNTHLESVINLAGRHGVNYQLVPTDEPLERVLFDFVSRRTG